jgi:glycosyltransferase involved in cell wall biosynthesis
MPRLYPDLTALVVPSRTLPNWKEQFGRVIVEAMASGVPVIGARSGAIPDVIGDSGLLFPEGDVDALATHMARLLTDSALRAALAQKGRARVLAHFTHAQVAAQTVAFYRALLR